VRNVGSNNQVLENYIGTDGTGMLPGSGTVVGMFGVGNGVGMFGVGSNNVVGGTGVVTRTGDVPAEGNVIEGTGYGVDFGYGGADQTLVEGNNIGTNASGTETPSGEQGVGILIFGPAKHSIIDDNILSGWSMQYGQYGNGQVVVVSGPGPSTTLLEGNIIGPIFAGNVPILNPNDGNLIPGVFDDAGCDLTSNTIAFNTGPGVFEQGTGADIEGNSIYCNGDLGIDLGGLNFASGRPDVVNTNAANDAANHAGPNDLMNFPVVTPFPFRRKP
jgi:hypothetical protein